MPEHLIVPVEWKAAPGGADAGELEGYASVFGNVDLDNDVVLPGAFKKTLADWSKSRQPLPLIADHKLSTEGVIGSVRHAEEDGVGLRVRAGFSRTQKAQDIRANMIDGHLRGMSFTYEAIRSFPGKVAGKSARFLQELRLFEVTVSPFPINQLATASAKAAMSSAAINDLPDSAFAYIEPGGTKDAEGKTTPRSKRHFPVHDEAHARNALSRAPDSPFGKLAMPKILAACRKFGIQVTQSAAMDFSVWAESMRAALAIPDEAACKAAANILVAGYTTEDFAAGLADEPDPTAAAAADGTAAESKSAYALGFIARPPEPPDGALNPLAALETARANADLDRVEAEIKNALGARNAR
jgi:HK97 family phage prohead protease